MPNSTFPTVASRIAHIMQACGYPTKAALARALGLKNAQNIGVWEGRGSFGNGGLAISDATGADMKWLATGKGEPFPNGPVLYAGAQLSGRGAMQRLEDIERDLTDIVTAISVSLRRFSATTPVAAEGVAADLRQHLSRPGRPSAVLPELLRAVESALLPDALAAPKKKPQSSK